MSHTTCPLVTNTLSTWNPLLHCKQELRSHYAQNPTSSNKRLEMAFSQEKPLQKLSCKETVRAEVSVRVCTVEYDAGKTMSGVRFRDILMTWDEPLPVRSH